MPGTARDPDDANEIGQSGWRQCSVAPAELAERLRTGGLLAELGDRPLLVVASHDCDVTNPSFRNEPQVEFLIARPVDALDGSLTRGKNPRLLQCEVITPHGTQAYEFSANERLGVDRRLLLGCPPETAYTLTPGDRALVARWLAKRYD